MGDHEAEKSRSIPGMDGQGLWRPEELASILRHQLSAPVELDLQRLGPIPAAHVGRLLETATPPIRSFGDLFGHPRPPLELLELAKEFAKASPQSSDAPLPDEIAAVFYVLSIVVARVRCGRRITEMDDVALRRQLRWAAGQPWVDAETCGRLLEGLRVLEGGAPGREVGGAGTEGDSPVFAGAKIGTVPGAQPEETRAMPPPASGASDMSELHDLSLGQLGEYQLVERLGEGGMGTVYKALHIQLDRWVAIKVLRPGLVQEEWAVARFRREIKAAGRIDHPHVVRALDARQLGNTYFLVMEYVDGLDLDAISRRMGPLPVAEACEMVRQAAIGLQSAQQFGMVHRDIKPSNLMLSRQGQVKILDLGLARTGTVSAGQEMTAVGQVMGTPDYMAPEQVTDSHAADIRADIYSLGCTLYKLLTGEPPFAAPRYGTAQEKLRAHLAEPAPAIDRARTDLPPGLAAVVARMLAKNPAQRFALPQEVAEALAPFAATCDLPGLLCCAETPGTVPIFPPTKLGPSPSQPAARGDDRHVAGPGLSPAPVTGRNKILWRVAAASMLAALVGLGLLAVLARRPGDGSSDAPGQGGPDATAQSPAPGPVWDPAALKGWIVLSWGAPRWGKPGLWLLRADGKARARLTGDAATFDVQPRFSPDGRRIAFVRGTAVGEPTGLWLCNADGGDSRQVVTAQAKTERVGSPVWISNSRIYYVRDPMVDRSPDMEVWQTDVDAPAAPQLVFRFQAVYGKGSGLLTDVSPDRTQLVAIAQDALRGATADVFLCDLNGKAVHVLWSDRPEQHKDGRALWSPEGRRIAWQHDFTSGGTETAAHFGVAMARLGDDGRWATELQPDQSVSVTPLAWSPRGECLLCARIEPASQGPSRAMLCYTDDRFRQLQDVLSLDATFWQANPRDVGRLADWAIVPADLESRIPLQRGGFR